MSDRRITSHLLNLWHRLECRCGYNTGRFTPVEIPRHTAEEDATAPQTVCNPRARKTAGNSPVESDDREASGECVPAENLSSPNGEGEPTARTDARKHG